MRPTAGCNRHSSSLYMSMALGLLLGFFVLSITGIHSTALTTSSISCVTAEDAPSATLSLIASGNVSVTPTSFVCNGESVSLSLTLPVKGNGNISVEVPPPSNVYTRDILTGDLQTQQIAQCTSSGCTFSVTQLAVYTQVEEFFSYKISGGGSGYTVPTLSYYYQGVPSSSALDTGVWLDCCSSEWSAPHTLTGSILTEQWAANPADLEGLASPASAGSSIEITYYNQYPLTSSFTVTSGSGYQNPQLRYTQYGVSQQVQSTSYPTSFWADAGTLWSISSTLPGPTASEQWAAAPNSVLAGTVSAPMTISPHYFHQYLVTANYTIIGTGSSGYGNPTFFYTSLGSVNFTTLATSPVEYWVDAATQWNVSNALAGNSTLQRWQTNQQTSGSITSAENITIAYYWQYFVTFQFSVVGGGDNYIAPSLNYSQFGITQAGSQGLQAWADVGSNCSYTNPLQGSSSSERWFASLPTLTVSSNVVNATYYHQFSYFASYAIVDGGDGYSSPIFSYTSFGSSNETFLSTSATTYWLDYNTPWSTTSLLPGSSSVERWATEQAIQGMATTPASTEFHYFNQYALTLKYVVTYGGSPPAPTLNFTSFGTFNSTSLGTSPTLYWVDAGSPWALTNSLQLPSSASSERWITNMTTVQTAASAALNQTIVYDHQYYLLVELNDAQGGSASSVTGWYNNGNKINIAATPNAGWEFVSWDGAGNAAYTGPQINGSVSLTSPVNETAIFYAGLVISSGPNGSAEYNYGNLSGIQSGIVQPGSNRTIFVLPNTVVNLTESPSSVIYIFHGWSGSTKANSISALINVNIPKSIKASFVLDYADITVFGIVTAGVIVLSVGAFPVRFKIREIFPKKRESSSQISGKV
jgi:hypothetical protein